MSPGLPSWLSQVSGRCQAMALDGARRGLRALGPTRSSALGGWIARGIGPHLSPSRTADANLRQALPELDAAQRSAIIRAVWDNLGRTAAELPHLHRLLRTPAGPGWEVEGEQHVTGLLAGGGQALFFSGHFGNWEMVLPIAAQLGLPVARFYRAASNPRVDAALQRMRLGAGGVMFAKGADGARAALRHLQGGGSLGLLIDQKMNDGIPAPFLGRDAMTAPGLAQMALRFALPVFPIRVLRLGPARFRLVCEAPVKALRTGERTADVRALTVAINAVLERWVREDPGAWLWLHRRWPRDGGG